MHFCTECKCAVLKCENKYGRAIYTSSARSFVALLPKFTSTLSRLPARTKRAPTATGPSIGLAAFHFARCPMVDCLSAWQQAGRATRKLKRRTPGETDRQTQDFFTGTLPTRGRLCATMFLTFVNVPAICNIFVSSHAPQKYCMSMSFRKETLVGHAIYSCVR